MKTEANRRHGILWTEVIVAIPIMGLLVVLTGSTFLQYYRFRNESVSRQAAAWAAAGQLQRYQAGAALDSTPPPGTLPPEVTLKTVATRGRGPWEGFQLVTVTATAQFGDRPVREQISGYVRPEVKP